jgi:hypothetical protein
VLQRRLIRRAGLGLALAAIGARLFADTTSAGIRLNNVTDQQTAAAKFLDGLARQARSPDGLTQRQRMMRLAGNPVPPPSRAEMAQMGRSAYQSNQVVAAMDVVGALGQAAVGTSQQANQAALLRQYAALLAGNSNANLSTASSALSQEAQAVSDGDQAAAMAAAQQIQSISLETVPADYLPTDADQAASSSLAASTGYDWASMFMALGQAVLAAVMGFISGGPYGAIAGAAVSLITSAINGSFTSQTTTLASGSSSAAGDIGTEASSASQGLVAGAIAGAALKSNSGALGSNNVIQAPSGAANVQIQNGQGVASTGALPGSVPK